MKITKYARREAKQLFRVCVVEGALAEDRVRQAVTAVLERRPRGYLAILTHFERLVRLEVARRTARIESAVPLAADLQAGLSDHLTRRFGPGLSQHFESNPALIGGLRVQVGSTVYDGSIRARLESLKEAF